MKTQVMNCTGVQVLEDRVDTVIGDGGGVRAQIAARGIAVAIWCCVSAFGFLPAAPTVSALVPALGAEAPFAPFVDIQGTHLAGSDDAGRLQWEMQAQSVQLDKNRSIVMLTGVTGWLYHNGKQQVHLVAPRATDRKSTRLNSSHHSISY